MKNLSLLLLLSSLSFSAVSQNDFAFDMYAKMDAKKNILFSPTSIQTAFAMAYEGANGETQTEFEKVFGFKEDNAAFLAETEHLKSLAEISNSIWILENYEVLQSYIETMKSSFGAAPNYTDFLNDAEGSAKRINEWIEESTNGMIKKMLNPADVKEFKLALVNAIYFKQGWEKPFNEKRTVVDSFTNYKGAKAQVDMMHALDHYRAFAGKNEKVIELPYEDNKTSMVVVLPNSMDGYEMTNEVYSELMTKLYMQKVNLDLVKFTFETPTFELKPFLQDLGMNLTFSDYADFSGMRKEKDLKIGTALHKAKIIVNEEGTEAAGATVIGMVQTTSAAPNPTPIMQLRVDKPFYYFIKDNQTGAILFLGRMNEI